MKKKPWKTISQPLFLKKNRITASVIIKELDKKKIYLSPWIIDLFKNYKCKLKTTDFPIKLYVIKVKDLGFKKPTSLDKIYRRIKKNYYDLVLPEICLLARLYYFEQKKGEWLRFATPLKSLIDSDGVPHLPKLGRALKKYFVETYWAYPKAIFHPNNNFVVIAK